MRRSCPNYALPLAFVGLFASACDPAPTPDEPTSVDGLPCVPEKESEVCFTGFGGTAGTIRARCNPTTRTWQQLTRCNWNQVCTEVPDWKDASKTVAECKLASWASSGSTTSGSDTTSAPPDAKKDTEAPATVCPKTCPTGTFCFSGTCEDACLGSCLLGWKCVQPIPGQKGTCEKSGCALPTALAKEAQWIAVIGLADPASACDLSGDGTPDGLPAELTQVMAVGTGFAQFEHPVLAVTSWALATTPPNGVDLLLGKADPPVACTAGASCALAVSAASYDVASPLAKCPALLEFGKTTSGGPPEFKAKAAPAYVLGTALATAKGPAPVQLGHLRLRIEAPTLGNWSGPMKGVVCGTLTVQEVAAALTLRGVDKAKMQALFESVATFDTDADTKPDAVPVALAFQSSPAQLTKLVK